MIRINTRSAVNALSWAGLVTLLATPQATAPGSVGTLLKLGGGPAGTPGTQLAGATQIDLGTAVANVSAKCSFLVGGLSVLDISQTTATQVTIAPAGSVNTLVLLASGSIRLATGNIFWASGSGDRSFIFSNAGGATGDAVTLQSQSGTATGGAMTLSSGAGPAAGALQLQAGGVTRIKADSTGIGFFNHATAAQQASGGTLAGVIAGLVASGLFAS